MSKSKNTFYTALLFLTTSLVFGQSEATVQFLLINPSNVAMGKGGASVVNAYYDPSSVLFNPANIADLYIDKKYSIVGQTHLKSSGWLPQLMSDLSYTSLTNQYGFKIPNTRLTLAAGYSFIHFDLGKQNINAEDSPVTIATFHAKENAHVFTLGMNYEYYIKLNVGFNAKKFTSKLTPPQPASATDPLENRSVAGWGYDWGYSIKAPLLDWYDFKQHSKIFIPFLNLGYGFSKSNIGDEVTYPDQEQSDPIPRIARQGLNLFGGLKILSNDFNFDILSINYSRELSDLLINRYIDSSGEVQIEYEGGNGNINFWDNIFNKNIHMKVISERGIEMNFIEILMVRTGKHRDIRGKVIYDTFGYSFHSVGAFKLLSFFDPGLNQSNSLFNFLLNSDIYFDYYKLEPINCGHPLDNTWHTSLGAKIYF
ncbi:MAG: hypothetical protein DWQ05_17880 [Calditrichaeota bacterium]|nr:MAG: hypothetical protein DWQ05_17880 [Calditrichota bacterium]